MNDDVYNKLSSCRYITDTTDIDTFIRKDKIAFFSLINVKDMLAKQVGSIYAHKR